MEAFRLKRELQRLDIEERWAPSVGSHPFCRYGETLPSSLKVRISPQV